MATYYRDDAVQVTSDAIRIEHQAFRVRQVEYVWHRQKRSAGWTASRVLAWTVVIAMLAGLVAIAAGLIVTIVGSDRDTLTKVLLCVLTVAVALVLGVVLAPLFDIALRMMDRSFDRGTQTHEMWARWRGSDVLLLRSTDAHRFGKIYRAVQRVMELHE